MDRVVVRIKETECLFEEKIDVLKCGICSSFFPISIMHSVSGMVGYCNTEGYRKIGDYKELTAKSLFMALEQIFRAIEECTQFLIFPEEFVININTIYIDERFNHAKFIYIPDDKCKYKQKIKILLAELSNITTEEGRLYLEIFKKTFEEENLSYLKIKYVISKILGKIKKDQTY